MLFKMNYKIERDLDYGSEYKQNEHSKNLISTAVSVNSAATKDSQDVQAIFMYLGGSFLARAKIRYLRNRSSKTPFTNL